MATFSQWRAAMDRGDLRRVTWVCGPERTLVEEVVDTTRDRVGATVLDAVTMIGGVDTDADIWAQASQYPLDPGAARLIIVREAQAVRAWRLLQHWLANLRNLPNVYLLLVSTDLEVPATTVDGKKVTAEHIAWIRAPRGHVVRCSAPNYEDAVAWVCRHATLNPDTAAHLLTRVGGDLRAAAVVCRKLSLFPGVPVSPRAIDLLVNELPGNGFVDALIALHRREALLALEQLSDGEKLGALTTLDARLDTLAILNKAVRTGLKPRDIQGVPHYRIRQYWDHAKHYDQPRCVYRRRLLAVLDDAVRSGARTGAYEALVALW